MSRPRYSAGPPATIVTNAHIRRFCDGRLIRVKNGISSGSARILRYSSSTTASTAGAPPRRSYRVGSVVSMDSTRPRQAPPLPEYSVLICDSTSRIAGHRYCPERGIGRSPMTATVPATPLLQRWPLVGRHHELDVLKDAIAEPSCVAAVIAGPAGVGKTRLASELLTDAERAGHAVAKVAASRAAAALPLGAVARLLATEASSTDDEVDPMRLLQRLHQALEPR